jgi:hypothetical protein
MWPAHSLQTVQARMCAALRRPALPLLRRIAYARDTLGGCCQTGNAPETLSGLSDTQRKICDGRRSAERSKHVVFDLHKLQH